MRNCGIWSGLCSTGIPEVREIPSMKHATSLLTAFLYTTLFGLPAVAQDPLPKTAETFVIDGHEAFVHAAPRPAEGRPWLWYAPTLKGVSLVQRRLYFDSLMHAGISIAGFDLGE